MEVNRIVFGAICLGHSQPAFQHAIPRYRSLFDDEYVQYLINIEVPYLDKGLQSLFSEKRARGSELENHSTQKTISHRRCECTLWVM